MYPHPDAFCMLASSVSDSCLFVQIVFISTMFLNGMFSLFIIVAAKMKHILDTKRQNKTRPRYKVPIFNTPKFHHPIFTQNRQMISMPKYPDLLYYTHFLSSIIYLTKLRQWCNGQHARFKYGRSWFESRSGQTKDYEIGICCFSRSAKHAALRSQSKDWLAWNHNNVSELTDRCFSQLALKIPLNMLAGTNRTSSSPSSHQNLTCSSHDISEKLLI